MELPRSQLPPPPPPPPPTLAAAAEPVTSVPRVRNSEMEIPQIPDELSTAWEWGALLDFAVDDQLFASWDSDNQANASVPETLPEPSSNRESDDSDRVRKRDPRLTCSNFLAGRIPCSCPEVDEKDEEEEGVVKKRTRTATPGTARCQVPGCEADISELKGYHRRHRVCLRCANASAVVLHGQTKRYCQQCGKFHILSDFDEGKRSCRRKLEHHNKRRRRKSVDFRGAVEKESQGSLQAEDIACDGESDKDGLFLSDQGTDREVLVLSEGGHVSPLCSAPTSQNIPSDSVVSYMASGETKMDGEKENSKSAISSNFCGNKSGYSSMCPTGRISFKLYDWNPAEFPRRLRHQIFQWLASMPVELEGYIRPGCTILTVFIAMPRFMWEKLSKNGASYVHDIVSAPESMLSRRGMVHVYLNDMIFRVLKDGTSLMNVKIDVLAPRLHYVHPNCFEAGKPMEFVACGSNLLQPKFRFLVSFAGNYLAYDYCVAIPHGKSTGDATYNCEHQMYKIYIPHTEPKFFGPAFIEVENEYGLSNFIPILFGDREICCEMQMVQRSLEESFCSKRPLFAAIDAICESCQIFLLRQTAMSELILDIGWLLREPKLENVQKVLTSTQIQRINCLLDFLIKIDSTTILDKVLRTLKIVMHTEELYNLVKEADDADMGLLKKYMGHAREIACQRLQHSAELASHPGNSVPKKDSLSHSYDGNNVLSILPSTNQNMEMREEKVRAHATTDSQESSGMAPLLNGVVMNEDYQPRLVKVLPWKPSCLILSNNVMTSRPLVFLFATAILCCGICAILLHPQKVGEFTITIRRCLFGNHKP